MGSGIVRPVVVRPERVGMGPWSVIREGSIHDGGVDLMRKEGNYVSAS